MNAFALLTAALATVVLSVTADPCDGVGSMMLELRLWGAGGGQATGAPHRGGAGGFIKGRLCLAAGEQLKAVVGGAGGDQLSNTDCSNGGFPNGGCTILGGGGGGSSHVIALRSGVVALGAGGGGGGSDHGSGGGGGTCSGRVGQGARSLDGGGSDGLSGIDGGGGAGVHTGLAGAGSCGSGRGGRLAATGAEDGMDSNGAGGTGGGNYGAGGGGAASWLGVNVSSVVMVNASDSSPVALEELPPAFAGHKPGSHRTDGAVIAIDTHSGRIVASHFIAGEYTIQNTITAADLQVVFQNNFDAAFDCRSGGGRFNFSSGVCTSAGTSTQAPNSTTSCTGQDAFVGLSESGKLIICPSAEQDAVEIGGSLHNPDIAKLKSDVLRLSSNGVHGASRSCMRLWARSVAGCHTFQAPSTASSGRQSIVFELAGAGGGGGGGGARGSTGDTSMQGRPGQPSTLTGGDSVVIATAAGGAGGVDIGQSLIEQDAPLLADAHANISSTSHGHTKQGAFTLLEFAVLRGRGAAGGLPARTRNGTATMGRSGGLAIGQLATPDNATLTVCLGEGGAGGGHGPGARGLGPSGSAGGDGFVVIQYLDDNCEE